MKVNFEGKVIEMTAKFAKAAAKFGSDEYRQLQEVRRDYPGFKVETVSRKVSANKQTYKGLTYAHMEKYIKDHDDEQNSIMSEYEMLRGLSEEAEESLADSVSYIEMKAWFLNKYPAIAEFRQKRAMLLMA